MSESRSAIIYYGGFRSTSGGAYMHASLLHDALQDIGWSSTLVTLDSLPFSLKYLPHIFLNITKIFSPSFSLFSRERLYLTFLESCFHANCMTWLYLKMLTFLGT